MKHRYNLQIALKRAIVHFSMHNCITSRLANTKGEFGGRHIFTSFLNTCRIMVYDRRLLKDDLKAATKLLAPRLIIENTFEWIWFTSAKASVPAKIWRLYDHFNALHWRQYEPGLACWTLPIPLGVGVIANKNSNFRRKESLAREFYYIKM